MSSRLTWAAVISAVLCLLQSFFSLDTAASAKVNKSTVVLSAQPMSELAASTFASDSALLQIKAISELKYGRSDDSCVRISVGDNPIYELNPTTALVPASGIKLVVASVATDVLGSDYKFHTEVRGTIDDDGDVDDLTIVGGGDPLIATDAYSDAADKDAKAHSSLNELAQKVKTAGVKSITGTITVDDSRYDFERDVDGWKANYIPQFVAPLSALELNDNHRDNGGAISTDPAIYFGNAFSDLLRAQGVAVEADVDRGQATKTPKSIATLDSLPLQQIVADMLSNSNNTTAEMLTKEVGYSKEHMGTTTAGLKFVKQWLDQRKLPISDYVQFDGSGLATTDKVSCALLQNLVELNIGKIQSGFSIAGKSGTLRDRIHGPAVDVVRGKTGTLQNVSSLSGYLEIAGGPPVTFSAIDNGITSEAAAHTWQNDMANAFASFSTSYAASLAAK